MFKIIFVLIGTFVGAGFASGKEIFNFFTIYKYNSFFSIIVFATLLFLVIYKCLNIKTSLKISNYREFLFYCEKKYKFFYHRFFLFIINIFLASSFYIMVIALSSLFHYQLNIAKWITILFTICICYVILLKRDIHFIYVINSILMPILILFMLSLCFFNINLSAIDVSVSHNTSLFVIFMGLLYFSYNSLLLIPIVFDLKIDGNKKMNFKIAFFYSLIILIITFLVNLLLLSFYPLVEAVELPILYVSNSSIFFFSFVYFFVILSAIFTTMISSGYSFMSSLNSNNYRGKLIIFLLFSFILGNFSFSSLINFFYPLFGLVGFIQIFLIFLHKT